MGRAWPNNGAGGTLNSKGTDPGPYYCLAAGSVKQVGVAGKAQTDSTDILYRAVNYAVRAIQQGVNAANKANLLVDGIYGPKTTAAVLAWQKTLPASANVTPWGGVGSDTVKALFIPTLKKIAGDLYGPCYGLIQMESSWDPGAVGYADSNDLGLGQINGPANPTLSIADRFDVTVSMTYVRDRLRNAISQFDGDLRTAIASYNLGIGGARSWKAAGSPDQWTVGGQVRYVNKYIDTVLNASR